MPPVKKIGSEDPPLAGPPPPVAGADGIFWVGVATAGANVLTTGGGVEGTRVGAGGRGVAVAAGVVAEAVAVADGAVGAVGPAVGNVRGVVPVGVVVVVAVAVVVVVAVVLGAGVPPVWEPTSMPVNENCAQSGRTSADSRNTATTDVPRPWTTKQPLAFGPLVVSSLLLPPENADDVMQTKLVVLPTPTSTNADPVPASVVAWDAALQAALAAWASPGLETNPAAPTKRATPPITADARSRLPGTEMVLSK
ncbi:MAG: hypothetical protein ABIQ47_11915 [Tepidiformaceae bacterium]